MHTMSLMEDIFGNKPVQNQPSPFNPVPPQQNYPPQAQPYPEPNPFGPLPVQQPPQPFQQPYQQPVNTNIYAEQSIPFPPQNHPIQQQHQAQPRQEQFSHIAVAKLVFQEKKMQRIDSIVGIASGMLPIIVSIFWGVFGLGMAAIFFGYFVWRYIMVNKDTNYLKLKYGL